MVEEEQFECEIDAIKASLARARLDHEPEVYVCLGFPRCAFPGNGVCEFCGVIATDDDRPLEEILRLIMAGH